jgi:hypothetical protein
LGHGGARGGRRGESEYQSDAHGVNSCSWAPDCAGIGTLRLPRFAGIAAPLQIQHAAIAVREIAKSDANLYLERF